MFVTVLVPLDGSRFAEAALPIARRLTLGARGRMYLAMAHVPMTPVMGLGEMVVPPVGLDQELRQREQTYLADTAAGLGQVGDGSVEFRLIDGLAGESICQEAARIGADLIVMATHGRGAIGRLWLGSVADYVVRQATGPVLLVHPDRTGESGPDRPIHGLLAPLDLSTHAEAVLDPVVTLAQLTQAHLTLLHVVVPFFDLADVSLPYPVPQDPAITERRCAEAQRRLDHLADGLREQGVGVSTRVAIGASAAGGILDALDEARFDAVAVTTHGVGGLRRLLLGSVADKVIRGARKPVLVLRPSVKE
jgi:nucleotide-binding universal stress UspA family protein